MRVEFTRWVAERTGDTWGHFSETAATLIGAWKKTEFALAQPVSQSLSFSAKISSSCRILPADIMWANAARDLNLLCRKAETNSLATWVIRRSKEHKWWKPIPVNEMHSQASPQDIILPELLERRWLFLSHELEEYRIMPQFVAWAWIVSLNIPSAELVDS